MVAGEMSPAVRIGTLEGALCLTKAMDALLWGILCSNLKGRFTYVTNWDVGLEEVLTRMKTCFCVGDSGDSSVIVVTSAWAETLGMGIVHRHWVWTGSAMI